MSTHHAIIGALGAASRWRGSFDREAMREAWARGEPIKATARRLGCTATTARRIFRGLDAAHGAPRTMPAPRGIIARLLPSVLEELRAEGWPRWRERADNRQPQHQEA